MTSASTSGSGSGSGSDTVPTAAEVADWIVAWAQANGDNDLTNMKLQKLLYYAQGWHLAYYGAPAFADAVEAWEHGPVVSRVYHAFAAHGDQIIGSGVVDRTVRLGQRLGSLLARVWDTYGQFGAWKLRDMTHRERPWRLVYREGELHIEIPSSEMQDFFAHHATTTLTPEPNVFEDRRPVMLSTEDWPALQGIVDQTRRAQARLAQARPGRGVDEGDRGRPASGRA